MAQADTFGAATTATSYEIGGQTFQNMKARIHLSGDLKLRNGIVANVCEQAPEEIQEQFGALVVAKR